MASPTTPEQIHEVLKSVKYPGFSRDIVSFGLVRSIQCEDGLAVVRLEITTTDAQVPARIRQEVESAVKSLEGIREVQVEIAVKATRTPPKSADGTPTAMPGVRYTVAVASGKGGVGKSTFAVNLASALAAALGREIPARRVGIMDCDIYGPSIPLMVGLRGRPMVEGNHLVPMENHGLKVMSMGFLVDDDTPVVWRGPMIMKTIQQFVQNVSWGDLEVLVIDLPPGTGDAQLSLVQTIPLSGAVIVTTPQIASTQVARRGAIMLQKVNVPILGVAENMSYLEQEGTGQRLPIFGEGGGEATAKALQTEFLGQIPLDQKIREAGDLGRPLVLSQPGTAAAESFRAIAQRLLAILRKES